MKEVLRSAIVVLLTLAVLNSVYDHYYAIPKLRGQLKESISLTVKVLEKVSVRLKSLEESH